jgi:DNA polymerase III alpha subunit
MAAYMKIKSAGSGVNKEMQIDMAKQEAERMKVKIVPPDINGSGAGYEVLDENTIAMGFSSIKGMGEKAIQEVVKHQPYSSLKEFLHIVDARVVNKTKLEVLAKAGCFDSMGLSRKFVCEEALGIRNKLRTFMKRRVDDGYDAQMALDDFPIKISNEEWSKQQMLRHENEVLTRLISGNLMDLYPNFFKDPIAINFSSLKYKPNRTEVIAEFLVKTFLREFKIKNGKYTGKPMRKYLVCDKEGIETELTIWPSEVREVKKRVKEGSLVKAICQISDYNGSKTLMLRELVAVQ